MSKITDEARDHLKELCDVWRISRPILSDEDEQETIESARMRTLCEDDGQSRPFYITASRVKQRPIEWLWPGHFPCGMFSLIVGGHGTGKSFVALDMAARISTGAAWPCSTDTAQHGHTIILADEDSLDDTACPRLSALGANLNYVHFLQGETRSHEPGSPTIPIYDLSKQLLQADLMIQAYHARLFIIDPITAYMGSADQNNNAEVRMALAGLVGLAQKHRCAVVGLTHTSKTKYKKPRDAALGSVAFAAVARVMWLVEPIGNENSPRRSFRLAKANILPPNAPGQAFTFGDDSNCIVWDGEPYLPNAGKIKTASPVTAWLAKQLADGKKHDSRVILKRAKLRGILSADLMTKARKELGVLHRRVDENGDHWQVMWVPQKT